MTSQNGNFKGKKQMWAVTVYGSQPTGRGYQVCREVQMMAVPGANGDSLVKEYAPFIRHGGAWFRVYQIGPEKYILTEEASA